MALQGEVLEMEELRLEVNGREYTLPVLPGETLADLLRDRLRL